MKLLFFTMLLLFLGFASFGQQEDEKPTTIQQKVAEEAREIQENTNWDNPEEARKARIKLGNLMKQVDKEVGIETAELPIPAKLIFRLRGK